MAWLDKLFGREKTADGAALLAAAQAHAQAGRAEEAMQAYEKLLAADPGNIEALLYVANTAYELRQYGRALEHTATLHEKDPDSAVFLARCAACHHALGNLQRARDLGLLALERQEEMYDVHLMLSGIDLPGMPYREVMRRLHETLRPRTYVEVGVFRGDTLALATPGTRVLGVDPEPKIQAVLPPGAIVHAETSDDFFANHDVRAELGGLPVDLAFIDGMHRFEFALRDFMNLEALCTSSSVIMVHDCYPLNEATASREQNTTFWSGDIWRLIVLLKEHRPDLRISTVATMPTGLAIITGLNPASRYIADNLERMTAQGLAMDYALIAQDKAAALNRCENDWARIAALLPPAAVAA